MARHFTIVLAFAVAGLTACSPAAPSSGGGGGGTVAGRAYDSMCNFETHPPQKYSSVIWIWFGDFDEGQVASNSGVMPFTSSLMDRCGIALNYHNLTHPYVPNAIGATSGVVQGPVATADCAPTACPQHQTSIFDQLQAGARQWREFVLAPQGTCADTPASYYPSLAARCAQWEAPLGTPQSGELSDELFGGRLAAFTFVLPDVAHDTGPQADQFLTAWVPVITNSPQYRAGKVALLITWDQGQTNAAIGEPCSDHSHVDTVAYPGCQVALIALGPATGAARSNADFSHYSLLRTTEEMLGLQDFLGAAAEAPSMRAALHL